MTDKKTQSSDDGQHYACKEQLDKFGGKVSCCDCTGHDCKYGHDGVILEESDSETDYTIKDKAVLDRFDEEWEDGFEELFLYKRDYGWEFSITKTGNVATLIEFIRAELAKAREEVVREIDQAYYGSPSDAAFRRKFEVIKSKYLSKEEGK